MPSTSNNSINNAHPLAPQHPSNANSNVTQNRDAIEMEINSENVINDGTTSNNDQLSSVDTENQFQEPMNQVLDSSIIALPISAQNSEENSLSTSNSDLNLNSL